MTSKIIENHKIVTVEHELHLHKEGKFLSEKKQMNLVKPMDETCEGKLISKDDNKRLTLVHLRQINDKYYKVTEDFLNGYEVEKEDKYRFRKVDTTLSCEEIQQFEEDWETFWNPEITHKKVIENASKGIE